MHSPKFKSTELHSAYPSSGAIYAAHIVGTGNTGAHHLPTTCIPWEHLRNIAVCSCVSSIVTYNIYTIYIRIAFSPIPFTYIIPSDSHAILCMFESLIVRNAHRLHAGTYKYQSQINVLPCFHIKCCGNQATIYDYRRAALIFTLMCVIRW